MRRAAVVFLLAGIGAGSVPAAFAAGVRRVERSRLGMSALVVSRRGAELDPVRVRVARAGRVVIDQRVQDRERALLRDDRRAPVLIRDLDGDGVPQAIFNFRDDSAHGFEISVMSWGHRLVFHRWPDTGYKLRDYDGDGVTEIVSTDPAVGYLREPMWPVQVFHLTGAGLIDITRTRAGRPAVRWDLRTPSRAVPARSSGDSSANSPRRDTCASRCRAVAVTAA